MNIDFSAVFPLLMLVFLTVSVDLNATNQWFRALGIARIFRKVRRTTCSNSLCSASCAVGVAEYMVSPDRSVCCVSTATGSTGEQ